MLYCWLPNGKHKWFADRKQSAIWNFGNPKKNANHPTMKPIPLLAYPIRNSNAPSAAVMDYYVADQGVCFRRNDIKLLVQRIDDAVIVLFGIVRPFSDMTHEGVSSIRGVCLSLLVASGGTIGFISVTGRTDRIRQTARNY